MLYHYRLLRIANIDGITIIFSEERFFYCSVGEQEQLGRGYAEAGDLTADDKCIAHDLYGLLVILDVALYPNKPLVGVCFVISGKSKVCTSGIYNANIADVDVVDCLHSFPCIRYDYREDYYRWQNGQEYNGNQYFITCFHTRYIVLKSLRL